MKRLVRSGYRRRLAHGMHKMLLRSSFMPTVRRARTLNPNPPYVHPKPRTRSTRPRAASLQAPCLPLAAQGETRTLQTVRSETHAA